MHRFILTLGLAAGALATAAEPGYLEISFYQVRAGKAGARTAQLKKTGALLDQSGAAPGTRSVRMVRRYPIGAEHGYNDLSLTFRDEPRELDPAKGDPARSLAALLKSTGQNYDQYFAEMNAIWDTGAEKGWLVYELPFPTSEADSDFLRVHVFKDSKSAQKLFRGLPDLLGPQAFASYLDLIRGATAFTQIEIYHVEKVRAPKF